MSFLRHEERLGQFKCFVFLRIPAPDVWRISNNDICQAAMHARRSAQPYTYLVEMTACACLDSSEIETPA